LRVSNIGHLAARLHPDPAGKLIILVHTPYMAFLDKGMGENRRSIRIE